MSEPVSILLSIIGWIVKRSKEKSTHQGATLLVSILSYYVQPAMAEQIVVAGGSVLSLIHMIHEERQPEKLPEIEVKHDGGG